MLNFIVYNFHYQIAKPTEIDVPRAEMYGYAWNTNYSVVLKVVEPTKAIWRVRRL